MEIYNLTIKCSFELGCWTCVQMVMQSYHNGVRMFVLLAIINILKIIIITIVIIFVVIINFWLIK
jgi:hypothetical protein